MATFYISPTIVERLIDEADADQLVKSVDNDPLSSILERIYECHENPTRFKGKSDCYTIEDATMEELSALSEHLKVLLPEASKSEKAIIGHLRFKLAQLQRMPGVEMRTPALRGTIAALGDRNDEAHAE